MLQKVDNLRPTYPKTAQIKAIDKPDTSTAFFGRIRVTCV